MKKLLIVIFTILISVALISCGGSSSPAPAQTPQGGETPGSVEEQSGDTGKAMAALIGWMDAGKFSFDFTMTMEGPDGGMEGSGSIAADGGKSAVVMEMSVMGMTVKQRIISKDGKAYLLDDANKTYMTMSIGEAQGGVMTDYSGMKLTGSGTGQVNGKTLPYEDYTVAASNGTARYYFDGNDVYAIETNAEDYKIVMIITNQKNSVPAGAFDVPGDYTEGQGFGGMDISDFLPDDFELPEGVTLPEGFTLPTGN